MYDIAIIGAGASGITAGITAARQGKRVVILEHKDKIGKKILATGNGKCNFTNEDMSLDHFNGSSDLLEAVMKQFSKEDCVSWFENLGIVPKNKNGYYYPNSETAVSIVNAMQLEAAALSIEIKTSIELNDVTPSKYGYDLYTNQGKLTAKKLIFACGLLANPKLGSDGSAFDFIKAFGHRFNPIVPALCAYECKGFNFKAVAGVRCNARVSLFIDGDFSCQDTGELQLTDYGLSGIPIFQISSKASKAFIAGKACMISVDFMPELSSQALYDMLIKRRDNLADNRNIYDYFNSIFNSKLVSAIIEKVGINGKDRARDLKDNDIHNITSVIKELPCFISKFRSMDFAQVCAGGIKTDDIDIYRLESKLAEGLFFCGELLDVDGQCGGYNLQWAWSSGYVAGLNASK